MSKLDGITVGGDEGEQAIPIKTTLIVVSYSMVGKVGLVQYVLQQSAWSRGMLWGL